jgi:lipopolysaccharide transport system ATP-binding protein
MSDVAIRVEGLGKRYRVGERVRYLALRDVIARSIGAPFRRFRTSATPRLRHSSADVVWALKDVSFEVEHGDVVGIVGRNGSGKSTLLKILSRITEPTEGSAEIRGQVGSLLEVGTGFHPELTGRENIYLNGTILGMKKAQIDRQFDEIVAFAEIERFIDTPAKYYSSGMYVRLAFAVAAHLKSDILLVDEVLAVGDAAFQKKCLDKIADVARHGRTVLFVSHNAAIVNRLGRYAIWMDRGQLEMMGPTEKVMSAYLTVPSAAAHGLRVWQGSDEAPGTDKIRLWAVRILLHDRTISDTVDIQRRCFIEIEYELSRALTDIRICLRLVAGDGVVVFTSSDSSNAQWADKPRSSGRYVSRCEVPGNFLNEGSYRLTVSADIPFVEVLFFEENVLGLHVEQTGGVSGRFNERWPGVVCPSLQWDIEAVMPTRSYPLADQGCSA